MQSDSTSFSPSLSALAKTGDEQAKKYLDHHRISHIVALVIALIMLFVKQDLLAYLLAGMAVMAEFSAWWLRYWGEHYHHLSRELQRKAALQDAFGKPSDVEMDHLCQLFDDPHLFECAIQLDQSYQDVAYFTSNHSEGARRFLDNLQESAFFSSLLYKKVANHTSWVIGVVLFVVVVALFAIIPVVTGNSVSLIPKLFSLLFIFWLADELTVLFALKRAVASAIRVEDRVDNLLKTPDVPQEELLATFGDHVVTYAVATATAPPIPTKVYRKHRESIINLWEKRKAGRKIS